MHYREPEFLPWEGRRVPITFVGGYLGAGKTTAINELLAYADRPIAVIVNDVGTINIDASLIRKRHGDTIELTNGCICCSSIDEVGAAFDQLRLRPEPPDHVVVELSGIAEPQRMLPWGHSAGFRLDGVVVVVAADQLIDDAMPAWIRHHITAQIAIADLLILTKTDLVTHAEATEVRRRLAEQAPGTPVFAGGRERVGPGAVGRFLALGGSHAGRYGEATDVVPMPSLFDGHTATTIQFPTDIEVTELHTWLSALSHRPGAVLVRAKGVCATTDDGPVLVQVVGRRIEVTALTMAEMQPATGLVVITIEATNG